MLSIYHAQTLLVQSASKAMVLPEFDTAPKLEPFSVITTTSRILYKSEEDTDLRYRFSNMSRNLKRGS